MWEKFSGTSAGTRDMTDITYIILIGIPEGKIPLGKPKYRWKNYIKSGLNEMESEVVNLIHFVQNKFQ
jgi:hypothetical protein